MTGPPGGPERRDEPALLPRRAAGRGPPGSNLGSSRLTSRSCSPSARARGWTSARATAPPR